MRLYDSSIPSGNAYKVQLLLAELGLPYETTELDILASPPETRRPEFLAINPNGRIPTLVLDDGTVLPESNAILYYFAEGTDLWPASRIDRAQTLRWMFFEQYSHEPYVAVKMFWTFWGGLDNLSREMRERLDQRGQAALDVMAKHLDEHEYFVGDRFGIADIALYGYTHGCTHAGFRLGPSVYAWIERIRARPRHVKIKLDPLGKKPPT